METVCLWSPVSQSIGQGNGPSKRESWPQSLVLAFLSLSLSTSKDQRLLLVHGMTERLPSIVTVCLPSTASLIGGGQPFSQMLEMRLWVLWSKQLICPWKDCWMGQSWGKIHLWSDNQFKEPHRIDDDFGTSQEWCKAALLSLRRKVKAGHIGSYVWS